MLQEADLLTEEARLRAAGEDKVGDAPGGHHHHHHDHDHDDHPYQEDDDAGVTVLSPLQLRGRAVRNLLIARGILTAAEIRTQIEAMDSRGEHLGARVVVRAWTDPGFAARLAADAGAAVEELGLSRGETVLTALFNTQDVHNHVVCTLCSCYPRSVLGRPPIDWRLVTNLPVADFAAAVEKLGWYALRWKIETFHKVMKSGCRAEETRLETSDRLAKFLALIAVVSWWTCRVFMPF